jgi:hypothetical protein
MGRTITILGMGPSATERRHDILRYVEGEIWGLNNGYIHYPYLRGKWARFFELHNWEYLKAWQPAAGVDHFRELNKLGCPIYVSNTLPIIENQIRVNHVQNCLQLNSNYFLGSPSLMLMQALVEHDKGDTIDKICSWGIDTSDPAHGQQRSSWAYWISAARHRGITIGGTAMDFMAEFENDQGLRGLRELIGDKVQAIKTGAEPKQGE